jgi:putative Mg2+ transporter-C (MgtC) family protein
MELLWEDLTRGVPDRIHLAVMVIRLFAATLLGAIVGLQRERSGKPAGLRTHMLVSLGTALVVSVCVAIGMTTDGLSRVMQGVVTGIGFVGAGSILKLSQERKIKGLTTAAGLWITAAIGIAAGIGTIGLAVVATIFAVIVLGLEGVEDSLHRHYKNED